ncbi:MAG: hypothetical protein IPN34_26690 [Planctomycetes bacterium]|nr:hypothetical protein [Planctomycetota bacterium]
MSAPLLEAAGALTPLLAALGLGLLVQRALRCDAETRAAAGGLLGALWLGLCGIDLLLELLWSCAPALWRSGALALHGVGLACAIAALAQGALVAQRAGALVRRCWSAALPAAAVVALLALVPLATSGLAGVDALEVYRLKARALDEGTLDELAPRTLGASHPLFVPTAVAWHAVVSGEISAAAQIGLSLLAWLVAARVWLGVLQRAIDTRTASFALALFALAPPLLALVPRGEADLPLLASVLGAAACWSLGTPSARALAVLFAIGAAAAKNEGLAWIALGGVLGLARREGGSRHEARRACLGSAALAALLIVALRLPAFVSRARWGTFVEHLDGVDLGALLDPGYLVFRGGVVLEELGRAGWGPESGFAGPLWFLVLALVLSGRAPRARGPVLLGVAWIASVFAGLLLGGYDARWQTGVAAARIWIQASPWLVLALALCVEPRGGARAERARGAAVG